MKGHEDDCIDHKAMDNAPTFPCEACGIQIRDDQASSNAETHGHFYCDDQPCEEFGQALVEIGRLSARRIDGTWHGTDDLRVAGYIRSLRESFAIAYRG